MTDDTPPAVMGHYASHPADPGASHHVQEAGKPFPKIEPGAKNSAFNVTLPPATLTFNEGDVIPLLVPSSDYASAYAERPALLALLTSETLRSERMKDDLADSRGAITAMGTLIDRQSARIKALRKALEEIGEADHGEPGPWLSAHARAALAADDAAASTPSAINRP